jgi:hypothetical protein
MGLAQGYERRGQLTDGRLKLLGTSRPRRSAMNAASVSSRASMAFLHSFIVCTVTSGTGQVALSFASPALYEAQSGSSVRKYSLFVSAFVVPALGVVVGPLEQPHAVSAPPLKAKAKTTRAGVLPTREFYASRAQATSVSQGRSRPVA